MLGTSVRVATAPLVVMQTRASVKMALARPHIERHSHKMREAQANGDTAGVEAAGAALKEEMAKRGVKPLAAFIPIFATAPVYISLFMAARSCVGWMDAFLVSLEWC